jgi:hypothetical protein
MNMNECKSCKNTFEIPKEDLDFLDRVSPVFGCEKFLIPSPKMCPACRQQRRLLMRNEMSLYKRKCDATGKEIVSVYSPETPCRIYDQEEWWSDRWDAMDYGRDFDFNRPFFEQFKELLNEVPRMSLVNISQENSYYSSYCLSNKDCYLIYTADYNERCLYGRMALSNYDCMDFDITEKSNQCYECIDTYGSTSCMFSQKLDDSYDCLFSYNLKSCKNCLFCVNLKSKDFHIFNKPVSKEEFSRMKKEVLSSRKFINLAKDKLEEEKLKYPRKNTENINCESCLGNHLIDSKNAVECFDSRNLEDCKYCANVIDCKDCYDWDFVGIKSELCYQVCSSAYQLSNCIFITNCWENVSNVMYSDHLVGVSNSFGCVGLRQKKYCILNKQYSKEDYEEIVPRIIEHMKKTGEWGQFFPSDISPFAYNETIAQLYHPLDEETAIECGFTWRQDQSQNNQNIIKVEVPDTIQETEDTICKKILTCEQTGKFYKLIPQELRFYRDNDLPIPTISPEARRTNRMGTRTPRQLFNRTCTNCAKAITTTYSPDRPEKVYCEECYLAEVY